MSDKKYRITTSIPYSKKPELEKQASAMGLSVASYVRVLIYNDLNKHNSQN